MIKKLISKPFFLYLIFLIIFFCLILFKQVTVNYLDHSDGSYLYVSKLILSGKVPYKDFMAPQPPALFYFGALILSLKKSIIFVRFVNLFLYVFDNILIYKIIERSFKHKWLPFVVSAYCFFMPISVYWWLTFTTETLLRPIFLLSVYLLLPVNRLSKPKLIAVSILTVLSIFTKYTFFPLFIMTTLFLFFSDRKKFTNYIFLTSILIILSVISLQLFSGGRFIFDTLLIRQIFPLKDFKEIALNMSVFSFYYLPFIVINIIGAIMFFRKKEYGKAYLLLIPIFFVVNLTTTAFEGTYNYIFFPIELFFPLGIFIFILNRKELEPTKISKFKEFFINVSIFLGSLCLIYFFQIFYSNVQLSYNISDTNIIDRVVKITEENTSSRQRILAPPYFAILTDKNLLGDYGDPFLGLAIYNSRFYNALLKDKIKVIQRSLENREAPVVILDWRLKNIKEIDYPVEKYYKKVFETSFNFNTSEWIQVYVKK